MELSKENQNWLKWVNSKKASPKQLAITISANKIKVVLYGMDSALSRGESKNSFNEAIDKCKMTFAENNLIKHIFGEKALNSDHEINK